MQVGIAKTSVLACCDSTYSLVHVDGVLARDDIGDGRALLLAGLNGGGHF